MSRLSIAVLICIFLLTLLGGIWIGKTWGTEEQPPQENFQEPSPLVSSVSTNEDCPAAPNNDKGPWNGKLEITSFSADGKQKTGNAEIFVDRGGVPTMIQDVDGRLIAAFQWFPCDNVEAFDKVAVKISDDDGATWSDPELIDVNGLPEGYQRPFDPTLVLTPEGKIRLYFTSSEKTGPMGAAMNIYSAISDDGVHYTFEEGARFDLEDAVFDSAVAYWNDLWYLVTPLNKDGKPEGAYYATAEDGLNFTRQEDIDNYEDTGWTGNFIVIDDALRFYGVGTRTSGMGWTETTDGKTWSTPQYFSNFFGADPAVACLKDHCLMVTAARRS